jgi:hypothetical protein
MRRPIPAVLGLVLLAGCAPRPAAEVVGGAGAAEVALGPGGVRGLDGLDSLSAPDGGFLPLAALEGTWERPAAGGRVRYAFDQRTVRLAVLEEHSGREAFYVLGQWSLSGRNILICQATSASLTADAHAIPELDGAGVVRTHSFFEDGTFTMQLSEVGSFSFRMRRAGDGVVVDRFEGENFTDRTKRLFEGRYRRPAPSPPAS